MLNVTIPFAPLNGPFAIANPLEGAEALRPAGPGPQCDLRVALIGATALFGEVLVSALQAADPATSFARFELLDDWLASPDVSRDRVLLLFLTGDFASFLTSNESALDTLNRSGCLPRFIVFSNQAAHGEIMKAVQYGAGGYIVPSISLQVVVRIIHLIDAGGTFIPASSFTNLQAGERPTPAAGTASANDLSPRQTLVAKALRKGTPNKIIAYDLNMCESTVKVHVRHIMKKLNAKNRTQIAFLTNAMFVDEDAISGFHRSDRVVPA